MLNNAHFEFTTPDDVTLVRSAKEGNLAAFEGLVCRHTDTFLRVARRITNSHEDAEDAVQDAFLKAFQHLHRFEERARFSTWLTRIVINEALMKLRRRRGTRTVSIDNEAEGFRSMGDEVVDRRLNPEEIYRGTELAMVLHSALASLSDKYRVVFIMRDVEGFSTIDTAEMLELSVPSVKARLLRARLQLRASLSSYVERGNSRTSLSLAVEQTSDKLRAA
jgi:RNA polymerase sigma-70 factor (ECF subfamily)